MIKEFAVDPRAIAGSWKDFRYVTEKFGVEHGRVISRCPNRWLRAAYEAVRDNEALKDVRKESMRVRLEQLKRRKSLISFGRQSDGQLGWNEVTKSQHHQNPFFRLIVGEPWSETPEAVCVDDLEAEHFHVPREVTVLRTASELANTVKPLLALSKEIIFVDPHFDPRKPRFRRPLEAFLRVVASSHVVLKRCEYHMKQHENNRYEHDLKHFSAFSNACKKHLPRIIPQGMSLTLVRWKQLPRAQGMKGDRLHPRFILT